MKGLTAIGLAADIIGVVLIFWASKKTESPPYADAIRYRIFDKKVRWGLGLVIIGFLFQLAGAVWSK